MENSGKVLFSTFYINPNGDEQHDVVINKVETDKEGGDWSTDIIEAVNMVCFTMRVHSNLVGSVPGKTQTNNSGHLLGQTHRQATTPGVLLVRQRFLNRRNQDNLPLKMERTENPISPSIQQIYHQVWPQESHPYSQPNPTSHNYSRLSGHHPADARSYLTNR